MKIAFTLFITFLFSYSSFAQPGTLDSSFGADGKVLSTTAMGLPFATQSIIVKKDGAILVGSGEANSFLLKQFLNNGTPDSSFGVAGETRTIFKNLLGAHTTAVNITEDNKIVAAGIGYGSGRIHSSDVLLAKYSENGIADSSFGINGKVIADFNLIEVVNCMKITNQGKILVAGFCEAGDEGKDNCFLAQFESDGSVDTNFGDNGKVITDVGDSYQSYINSVAISSDGSIVAAGSAKFIPNSKQDQILLAKYDMNGKLKKEFGNNGLVFTSVGTDADYAYAVALQDDEKIVVAGAANYLVQDSTAMAIVRYNSDGSIDKSFNKTGSLSVFFGNDNARARALVIQSNGNFMLGGGKSQDYSSPYNYAAEDFALVSVTKEGKVDSSFGINGTVTTDFEESQDGCYAIALQADGKILAGGGVTDKSFEKTYIGLSRYNGYQNKKQIIIKKIKHYAATHNNAQATSLNNVSIYPNPAQNVLHVAGLSSNKTKLTVIDFMGNVKLQTIADISSFNLNIAALKPGNYFLKIEMSDVVVTKKFVKE